jgi:hypothetical protein
LACIVLLARKFRKRGVKWETTVGERAVLILT